MPHTRNITINNNNKLQKQLIVIVY